MLIVPWASEKLSWEGKPTAMDSALDTVEIDVPLSVADTRTGVGTVPELTRTTTSPLLSVFLVIVVCDAPSSVRPPDQMLAVRSIGWFGTPLPLASTRRNDTLANSV